MARGRPRSLPSCLRTRELRTRAPALDRSPGAQLVARPDPSDLLDELGAEGEMLDTAVDGRIQTLGRGGEVERLQTDEEVAKEDL